MTDPSSPPEDRPVPPQEMHDPLCSEGTWAGDQRMPCDCHLSKAVPPPEHREALAVCISDLEDYAIGARDPNLFVLVERFLAASSPAADAERFIYGPLLSEPEHANVVLEGIRERIERQAKEDYIYDSVECATADRAELWKWFTTEREMHNAWRKRAEECERAALSERAPEMTRCAKCDQPIPDLGDIRCVDCASERAPEPPAWCHIHQHFKWCEHNGGVAGSNGWRAPEPQK